MSWDKWWCWVWKGYAVTLHPGTLALTKAAATSALGLPTSFGLKPTADKASDNTGTSTPPASDNTGTSMPPESKQCSPLTNKSLVIQFCLRQHNLKSLLFAWPVQLFLWTKTHFCDKDDVMWIPVPSCSAFNRWRFSTEDKNQMWQSGQRVPQTDGEKWQVTAEGRN